jgi:hypothetical protein
MYFYQGWLWSYGYYTLMITSTTEGYNVVSWS